MNLKLAETETRKERKEEKEGKKMMHETFSMCACGE